LTAAARAEPAVRAAALRHLAEREDPAALDLIEAAAADPRREVAEAGARALSRMSGPQALDRARAWAGRHDELGAAAAALLAARGGAADGRLVLEALRRTVRVQGPDGDPGALWPLVDGAGRLGLAAAAPVLRYVYRETVSSQLRGRTAVALAATDPSFAAGFAVECLWDCEEDTRAVGARHATTGDARVVERLRSLAADPAEEAGVQTAVRGRLHEPPHPPAP
ncbi:HEAT repeat domain-containing protein, partial [Streptomyces sp. YIM 98790]|uniref:HEAT repeat domain-containing protein n=1 Tax=Streptomyces sp. YIM 98790 TaxID=2689077 RepID=UPI00140C0242